MFLSFCKWLDSEPFKTHVCLFFFFRADILFHQKSLGPPSVQQISSTRKFNGNSFSAPKIPHFHIRSLSVQHTPQFHTKNPQFNTHLSSTPKPLSSTHSSVQHQKNPQFHTRTLQFNTLLSSTPKTPHFHTPLSSTAKISQFHILLELGVC